MLFFLRPGCPAWGGVIGRLRGSKCHLGPAARWPPGAVLHHLAAPSRPLEMLCHLLGCMENQSPGTRKRARTPTAPELLALRVSGQLHLLSRVPPPPRCAAPDKQRSVAETEISMIGPGTDIKQKYTLLQAQCLSKKSLSYDSQKSIHLSDKYWLSALQGTRRRGPGKQGT